MSLVWILLAVVSQFVVMAIFFKDSSPALIRTEPRGPNKKKNLTKLVVIKTCQSYLFQMTCSADQP